MLQQLQPPFDLHLSSVSELGLEIFHVGVQLCISINLQSLLSSNLSFVSKFMAGGEKVLLEGLKFSPRFVDAHCTQRGRALPFCVHHSGDHRCNPSACIILRVLCLLTDMHPSKMKTIQVSSRGSCKSAPNA